MSRWPQLETTWASLLHCLSLLSLVSTLGEIILEKTQLSTMKLQTFEIVMATASRDHGTHAPGFTLVESSSSNRNIQCHYYNKFGHKYNDFRKWIPEKIIGLLVKRLLLSLILIHQIGLSPTLYPNPILSFLLEN